jgi:hypothetical protein
MTFPLPSFFLHGTGKRKHGILPSEKSEIKKGQNSPGRFYLLPFCIFEQPKNNLPD